MNLKRITEIIADDINATMGIDPIKGFPNWANASVTLPAISLLLWSDIMWQRRVGGQARIKWPYVVVLYARHEIELSDMVEKFVTRYVNTQTIVDGSDKIRVALGDLTARQPPLPNFSQEDYSYRFTLVAEEVPSV